jgi:hypothetical protein
MVGETTTPEATVSKIEGVKVRVGDHLFVTSEPNRGAPVQVVGFNLDHEPICERTDDKPLEWRGVRRHVLDVPFGCLSYKRPGPSLLEAAEAVVGAATHWKRISRDDSGNRDRDPWGYMNDLHDAVEREREG